MLRTTKLTQHTSSCLPNLTVITTTRTPVSLPVTHNTSRVLLRYVSFLPLQPTPSSADDPQATIGSVTGNQAWATSGEQDKNQAIDAMKAASENRDTSQGYGGVEQAAGNLVGCEGMQKEGEESKKQ